MNIDKLIVCRVYDEYCDTCDHWEDRNLNGFLSYVDHIPDTAQEGERACACDENHVCGLHLNDDWSKETDNQIAKRKIEEAVLYLTEKNGTYPTLGIVRDWIDQEDK